MSNKENQIHFFWLFKYLFVFLLGIIFFSFKIFYFREETFGNWLFLIIFSALSISYYLTRKDFYYIYGEESILVKGFCRTPVEIDYKKINEIFLRQTPLNKMFGLYDLIIRFDSPNNFEETTLRAFGLSRKYFVDPDLPGIWGDLFTIPSLTRDNVEGLKKKLSEKYPDLPEMKYIGLGYPYYNTTVRVWFFLRIFLVTLIVVTLLIGLIMYCYLKQVA